MIYLCEPCKLVNTACSESCKLCRATCGTTCKTCGKCWDGLFEIFVPITQFPLGSYVMGTWVTMIIVVVASVRTLAEIDPDGDGCDKSQMYFFVNCGFALLHFIAARYIQWQIVKKVKEIMAERHPGEEVKGRDIPHSIIAESAYAVALYDVGFCLYFFVFAGSFGFNVWGMATFPTCTNSEPGWGAGTAMIIYGIGVWNYFFCWYCKQYCCGKAKPPPKQTAGADPEAQTMGQS